MIADLVGKGRRDHAGPVLRAINKAGGWGDGMSPKVLWEAVRAAAARRERPTGNRT